MASKNRNIRNNFAKEREEFEKQRKELEAQMHQGKQNLGHIRKGLRTNEISHLKDIETDADKHEKGTHKDISHTPKKRPSVQHMGKSQSHLLSNHGHAASAYPSTHGNSSSHTPELTKSPSFDKYIPPTRRVSDWFFVTEDLSTKPAAVKTQDVYTTVRFLGRGAFGSVDLVKHNDDNRLYAQKTILIENTDVVEEDLFREVQSLRVNRHPFIVTVSDVYYLLSPRRLFIVLQYCDAGDLAKAIQTNQKSQTYFSESQIVKWLGQIGLALEFLHSHHYLHRDIKPANVLLCDNGDIVKLGDFGFATQIDESKPQSLSTAEIGTPYYTAPEMIRQEPCSYPSDVWSFGIMLYELVLLGVHPFEGECTTDLVRGIMNEDPPAPPPLYSSDFINIATQLLLKDPTQRMTMSQFLASPLVANKVCAIPNNFKPKYHIEERFRRSQIRQLSHQLERLHILKSGQAHQNSRTNLYLGGDAPAPAVSVARKHSISESDMKRYGLNSDDSFEETKIKLSTGYAHQSHDKDDNSISLPNLTVASGDQAISHTTSGETIHLPKIGSSVTTPSKVLLKPSMDSHQEMEHEDVPEKIEFAQFGNSSDEDDDEDKPVSQSQNADASTKKDDLDEADKEVCIGKNPGNDSKGNS